MIMPVVKDWENKLSRFFFFGNTEPAPERVKKLVAMSREQLAELGESNKIQKTC